MRLYHIKTTLQAVATFQSDEIKYQIAAVGGIDKDERIAGISLSEKLSRAQENRVLLLFYDSIKVPASPILPPVMNASSPLIVGIESEVQSNVPIIGAGLVGDYQFNKTKQFCGATVCEQGAVGVILSGVGRCLSQHHARVLSR